MSVLAASFSLSSYAQTAYSPSVTLIKNQFSDTMTYDSIHITNNSPDTLHLNWELITNDTAAGSFFDFCSSGNCWAGIPNSGSFPPIEPGGFGWAGAHFWTGSMVAVCKAIIRIYDKDHPSASDTITFILNTVANGVHNLNSLNNSISVYPDPASDFIFITGLKDPSFTIKILNMSGQQIVKLKDLSQISTSGLSDGTYTLILNDNTGNQGNKKIIIHH